jgi:hypothetical protein
MIYSFETEYAKKYGVEEAILLQNFIFWINKNKANNVHFYEGKYWTYNSKKAMLELFPFWSESQLKRIINSLINQGVLITGNFNKSPYDKTTWYALEISIGRFQPIDETELTNREDETDQPIPDSKPVTKKEKLKENDIVDWNTLFTYWEQNKKGSKYKDDESRGRMLKKLKELTNNNLSFAKEAIFFAIDNSYQGFCNGSELYYKGKTTNKFGNWDSFND